MSHRLALTDSASPSAFDLPFVQAEGWLELILQGGINYTPEEELARARAMAGWALIALRDGMSRA